MHVVVVDFTVKTAFIDQFRQRVARQAADSLEREPNCLVFDVCVDPNTPDRVFLYEVYETKQDFADHLASVHFKAFDAEVGDWVADKQVRQLQKLDPTSE